ncbi:MAG: bis(5'-nucleosyl)-tetraphosphatase (symmetrical) YqeK [Clostridia bacterium]
MTADDMIAKLKATQNERRFNHTMGVAGEAVRLAPLFGVDSHKAYIAGLLHDCAKNFSEEKVEEYCEKYGVTLDPYCKTEKALVHGFLGPVVAKEDYGVDDPEILSAIYYHTTAKPDMSPLEKLIYIADMTEPGRTMEQSEQIRLLVEEDIDEALIYSIGCSIKHVIKKGNLIHPDSVFARNYLIENRRNNS